MSAKARLSAAWATLTETALTAGSQDAPTVRTGTRTASRFIPLTRHAVVADLCRDPLGKGDALPFLRVALRLQKHRGHHYNALSEELLRCYLPFSPDPDTLPEPCSEAELSRRKACLTELTGGLLDRANFTRLPPEELTAILSAQSPYALRISVDLSEYDDLQLYVRDAYVVRHLVRRPETLYILKASYEVKTYRRLFVLLKLKADEARAEEVAAARGIPFARALRQVKRRRRQLPQDTAASHIYLKAFRDMPEHDLQILFPLREVQFRPFDKIKFLATAGGGTAFGLFTTTGKILVATNPFALGGALLGFGGLLARQVTAFFNQRTRYMMELAQKLFFHNLANNRAALTLLIDRAEEEDVKEDLIALYHCAGESIADEAAKKAEIERDLLDRHGAAVQFELHDALARLAADGIATTVEGVTRVATLAQAERIYDRLLEDDDEADRVHALEDLPHLTAREAEPA